MKHTWHNTYSSALRHRGATGQQMAHVLFVLFFGLSGVRTGDLRVDIGCTATALGGENLILSSTVFTDPAVKQHKLPRAIFLQRRGWA